jgi:hypothetical protein
MAVAGCFFFLCLCACDNLHYSRSATPAAQELAAFIWLAMIDRNECLKLDLEVLLSMRSISVEHIGSFPWINLAAN